MICRITEPDQSPRVSHSRASLSPGSPRATLSKSTALNVIASERGASGGAEEKDTSLAAGFPLFQAPHHVQGVHRNVWCERKTLHNNRVAGWIDLKNRPWKQRKKKARTVLEKCPFVKLILIIQSDQSTANAITDLCNKILMVLVYHFHKVL